MRTIYKYELIPADWVELMLPYGAKPLHVQMQYGSAYLWAEVDTDETLQQRFRFRIAGTGHPLEADVGQYLNTFFVDHGALVFHVYAQEPQR